MRGAGSLTRLLIALSVVTLAMVGIAAAQAPPLVLPPSVEPGRLEQQFQPPAMPHEVKPAIAVPESPTNTPPPGAEQMEMHLESVTFEGATVYPPEVLNAIAEKYLKRQRLVLADLYRLADEVTAKYRSDGYVLSQAVVPAQRFTTTARIVVIEGFVSEVHVQGYDSSYIEAYARRIEASRPLRASDLERYMLLANDLPGVSARAVLAPSPSVMGGASLTIISEHTLADGTATADNRGTNYIGPYNFSTGAGVNVPGWDERIAGRFITTSSIRELRYGEVSATQPIGDDGLRLVLYGTENWSRPGYTLSQYNDVSFGSTYSATLSYPVIRSRDHNFELHAGFSVRDLITVVQDNRVTPPSSADHLRILRLGLSHDLADEYGGVTLLTLEGSQGLLAFGAAADNNRQTPPSRLGAQSNLLKAVGEISRRQELNWLYPGLSFVAAATGQVSGSSALPASEQFGVGGPLYGRAYDPSDIIGDEGWAAKAELQYTQGLTNAWLTSYQPYIFYDQGHVFDNRASAGSAQLSSGGFGVRLTITEHLSADLQAAKPLTRDESVVLDQPNARPWRFFFSVVSHF